MQLSTKRPPKVSESEKVQVRARRAIGHTFAIRSDEHGRDRLVRGTIESTRQYEISTGGVVRVRNIDPLVGISSLSDQQRKAGASYREDYEFCTREGLKTPGLQARVDGGKPGGLGVPIALLDAHSRLARARRQVAYPEIINILDCVVGQGITLRSLSEQSRNPRVVIVALLKIGLEKLTGFYGRRG